MTGSQYVVIDEANYFIDGPIVHPPKLADRPSYLAGQPNYECDECQAEVLDTYACFNVKTTCIDCCDRLYPGVCGH